MPADPQRADGQITGRPQSRRSPWARFSFRNPLLQIVLFAVFLVLAVLLMTRTLALPASHFSEESVGEPAQTDIKATRDFTYTEKDDEATKQKREEAARALPRIYDVQADLRDRRAQEVTQAFERMRRVLRRAEREKHLARLNAPSDDLDAGAPEQPVPAEEETAALTPEERLKIAELARLEFDQALQVIIPDEHFTALAQDGFSEATQQTITELLYDLLGRYIVQNRRLLELEGRRGIILRTLRDGEVVSSKRRYDFAEFMDATEVEDELARLTTGRLDEADKALRDATIGVAARMIKPNTTYNEQETEAARERARAEVPDLVVQKPFRKGQNIVDRGHLITAQHVRILHEMRGDDDSNEEARAQLLIGTVLLTLVLLALLFVFARRYLRGFNPTPKDLVFVGITLLLILALQQGARALLDEQEITWTGFNQPILHLAIPIALGAMLVRLVLTTEVALIYSVLAACFLGIAADQSLSFGIYALIVSTSAAAAVSKVSRRMDLMIAGVSTGVVSALGACTLALIADGATEPQVFAWAAGAAFAGGLASGILISALLPIVEWIFNYTTDIKLLELADLNHPALRELFMRAPGTYNHSIMVGNLCKEAAEAIGANSLLARVGSYYHDLGKGKNPQYFAENQRPGQNPHDKLKPNMSALVIKAHVKDGIEIARHYGLPREIQDFIAQHHGTSLIAYFYHKAKTQEDPNTPEVTEEDYRYPGPRPQTRETAICLLADGIEAASRAMPDPSPDRLQGLVQKMINKAFADGQLDECDITLKDLNAIARAFISVLCGMYHHRPAYPSDKRDEPKPAPAPPSPRPTTPITHTSIPPESAPSPGGRTTFEERLAESTPQLEARRVTTTPSAEQHTPHAPDPDHQSPHRGEPLDGADQRDAPEPTDEHPLHRLGLS